MKLYTKTADGLVVNDAPDLDEIKSMSVQELYHTAKKMQGEIHQNGLGWNYSTVTNSDIAETSFVARTDKDLAAAGNLEDMSDFIEIDFRFQRYYKDLRSPRKPEEDVVETKATALVSIASGPYRTLADLTVPGYVI